MRLNCLKSLDEDLPVIAAPMVCPTAEPIATPPAVAAICPNRPGERP